MEIEDLNVDISLNPFLEIIKAKLEVLRVDHPSLFNNSLEIISVEKRSST